MSKQAECYSNCIHWEHRKCSVTGQVKNDGPCTCGCFKPRTESRRFMELWMIRSLHAIVAKGIKSLTVPLVVESVR